MSITVMPSNLQRIISQWIPPGKVIGKPHKMREVADKLKDIPALNKAHNDYACTSLQRLRSDGIRGLTVSDYRHLSKGLTHSCIKCGNVNLMQEDHALFSSFIEELKKLIITGNITMLRWYRLLFYYFDCAVNRDSETEKNNWRLLRALLTDTLEHIYKNAPTHKPRWLICLNQNQNLLRANPCEAYADRLIAGDLDIVKPLQENLHIPANSWFWKEIISAQLRQVISYDDNEFIPRIDGMITLCKPYPSLINSAIYILLTRYAQSAVRSHEHKALKDITIAEWGSPTLSRQTKYGLVEENVKQMVREWVVAEDLKDFFSLLQDDGVADERRLNFWSQFIPQITYSRIVLGSDAWNDRRIDFVNLRKNKAGRVSHLTGNTAGSNNAFMMHIGDYLIVVFSKVGNACFIHKKSEIQLPFETKELDIDVLRSLSVNKKRWIQNSQWEIKFLTDLSRLGITLNGAPFNVVPSASDRISRQFNDYEFQSFVNIYKLLTTDNRARSGALWVSEKNITPQIANQLKAWGFALKQGKGYWKE